MELKHLTNCGDAVVLIAVQIQNTMMVRTMMKTTLETMVMTTLQIQIHLHLLQIQLHLLLIQLRLLQIQLQLLQLQLLQHQLLQTRINIYAAMLRSAGMT